MDLAALRTEFSARGFTDLESSNTRKDLWLNRAYHLICESHPWPFLETSTTGTAPLTISDLRQVLVVVDATNDNQLVYRDVRTLRESDPDLDDVGNPSHFWLDGSTTLRVWPLSTSASLTVRYLKVPTDLSSSSDTPVIPTRYHYLIVDRAVVFAYADSDNYEAASAVLAAFDADLRAMANTLMGRNYATPEVILNRAPAFDA